MSSKQVNEGLARRASLSLPQLQSLFDAFAVVTKGKDEAKVRESLGAGFLFAKKWPVFLRTPVRWTSLFSGFAARQDIGCCDDIKLEFRGSMVDFWHGHLKEHWG